MFLITKDQKKIKVENDVAKQIGLLADMNELFEEESDPVPLNDVTSKELKKCLAFCKRQLTKKSVEGQVSAWDRRFFDIERNEFFGKFSIIWKWSKTDFLAVLLAANYLDIPLLVDIGTTIIAEQIHGKEPAFIARYFGEEDRLDEMMEKLAKIKL